MQGLREIAAYVTDVRRRAAETRDARVIERRPDGKSYRCKLADTGHEIVAFVGQADIALTPRQRVVLARTDSSGRGHNDGWVIANPVVGSALATNVTTELTGSETVSTDVVTQMPMSIQLVAGGPSVTFEIYGPILAAFAVYGSVLITDDVAQVFSDVAGEQLRRLTLQVKAAAGCARGYYFLRIAGEFYLRFFEVI